MAWFILFLAGVFEVGWAYLLKQSDSFTRLLPFSAMVVMMIGSFGLLAMALRALPLGTAYAVWTGIGAVGTFVVGIILFGEALTMARVVSVCLIVAGMIGLKLSSA